MQAYVITIMDNERSVQAAERCIKSGERHGLKIEKFAAITPKDNPQEIFRQRNINPGPFDEKY